jgi:hypothetical protein
MGSRCEPSAHRGSQDERKLDSDGTARALRSKGEHIAGHEWR